MTQWGGGLYVGADMSSGQSTTANLNWNVYRDNRAGNGGGGMFCDDGATCLSYHEVYDKNCGSNILLDSGPSPATTTARFDHLTNVGALDVDCKTPGAGVRIDNVDAADVYSFVNAIFWGNAPGARFCRDLRHRLRQDPGQRLLFDGADPVSEPRREDLVRRRQS